MKASPSQPPSAPVHPAPRRQYAGKEVSVGARRALLLLAILLATSKVIAQSWPLAWPMLPGYQPPFGPAPGIYPIGLHNRNPIHPAPSPAGGCDDGCFQPDADFLLGSPWCPAAEYARDLEHLAGNVSTACPGSVPPCTYLTSGLWYKWQFSTKRDWLYLVTWEEPTYVIEGGMLAAEWSTKTLEVRGNGGTFTSPRYTIANPFNTAICFDGPRNIKVFVLEIPEILSTDCSTCLGGGPPGTPPGPPGHFGLGSGPYVSYNLGPIDTQQNALLSAQYGDPTVSGAPSILNPSSLKISGLTIVPNDPDDPPGTGIIEGSINRVTIGIPSGVTGFDINFYAKVDGTPESTPFITYTIRPISAVDHSARIIQTSASGLSITNDFIFSTTYNRWTATLANGLVKARVQKLVDDTFFTLVRDRIDGSTPISMAHELYKVGTDQRPYLLSQIVDRNGLHLLTTNTYDSSMRLTKTVDHLGNWTAYEYDSLSRVTRMQQPHGNYAPSGTISADQTHRFDFSYTPLENDDNSPDRTQRARTIEEYITGTCVGRTWRIFRADSDVTIRAHSSSATSTDAGNLKTTNWLFTSGMLLGDVRATRHENGTATVLLHEALKDGANKTVAYRLTTRSGALNTSATTLNDLVQDGVQTVSETDTNGFLTSEQTQTRYWNESSTLEAVTSFGRTIAYDSKRRVTKITHSDSSWEGFGYDDCCSTLHTTNRVGVRTDIVRNAAGQETSMTITRPEGSETLTQAYNAAGLLASRSRLLPDSSTLTLFTIYYDSAGRPTTVTSPSGITASFAHATAASRSASVQFLEGTTVRATATREFNLDRTVYRLTGSAVEPAQFAYWITNSSFAVTRNSLDSSGSVTPEAVTEVADFLSRPASVVLGDGKAILKSFNSLGELASTTDPDGVRTLMQYNTIGALVLSGLDLNNNGQIDFASDRLSKQHSTNISAAIDFHTGSAETLWHTTERFTFAQDNSSTAASIGTTYVRLDGTLQIIQFDLAGTTELSITAPANGLVLATKITPDGTRSYVTNRYGRTVGRSTRNSSGAVLASEVTSYNAVGQPLTSTDAFHGTTTYEYDTLGRLSAVTAPAPGNGQQKQRTTYFYSAMGQVIRVGLPDGTSVTNEYSPRGQLTKTYGSRTYPVQYDYDTQGRLTQLKTWQNFANNQNSATTTWTYDSRRGWLNSKTYEGNVTGPAYTYTPGGRLKTRAWARTIDGTERLTSTYRYGFESSGGGSSSPDLVGIDYNDSTPDVAYTWDRRGLLSQAVGTSPGNTVAYARAMTYDLAGHLLIETNTAGPLFGISLTHEYDSKLRATDLTVRSTTGILHSVHYAYDADGRLGTVSSPGNPQQSGNLNTAGYEYLANSGLLSSTRFTNAGALRMVTSRKLDQLGRLLAVESIATDGTVLSHHDYAYNEVNQRIRTTLADGSFWVYEYDRLGQVTSGRKYWRDGSPVAGMQFTYAYDDIGNRTSSSSGGDAAGENLRTTSYSASLLNQYTEITRPREWTLQGLVRTDSSLTLSPSVTPIRAGEHFAAEFTASGTNAQYQSVSITATPTSGSAETVTGSRAVPDAKENPTQDPDGNLLNTSLWTYTWDAENRLVQAVSKDTASNPLKKTVTYVYDDRWRLLARTVTTNSTGNAELESNRRLYDGWNVVAEFGKPTSGSWNLTQTLTWGLDLSQSKSGAGGVGGLLWVTIRTNVTTPSAQWACYDGSGNVVCLIDSIATAHFADYEYTPFGELVRANGPLAAANLVSWSSKWLDPLTGLVYYGFRWYDSSRGSWLSRDPAGEAGGLNLGQFSSSDPINKVDSDGRIIVSTAFFIWDLKEYARKVYEGTATWTDVAWLGLDVASILIDAGTMGGGGTALQLATGSLRVGQFAVKAAKCSANAAGIVNGVIHVAPTIEKAVDSFIQPQSSTPWTGELPPFKPIDLKVPTEAHMGNIPTSKYGEYLGTIEPPPGLKYGTCNFGTEMHSLVTDWLKGQDLIKSSRTELGMTGPDFYVDPRVWEGLTRLELKPATESGMRRFEEQVEKWAQKYDRPRSEFGGLFYDEFGNISASVSPK